MNVTVNQAEATMDNIVRSYLVDNGYNSLHKYARSLAFAYEGLTEFRWDNPQQLSTTTLTLNANKTADFPTDMVGWSRLYCKVGDRVQVFINDAYLSLHTVDDNTPNDNFMKNFIGSFEIDDAPYQLYSFDAGGVEAFMAQYFRVDKSKKQFLFGARLSATAEVFLEYIATGYSVSTETLVPVEAVKYLKSYIAYKWACQKFGMNSGEAQIWKKECVQDLHTIVNRSWSLDIRSIIESSLRRGDPHYRRMFY